MNKPSLLIAAIAAALATAGCEQQASAPAPAAPPATTASAPAPVLNVPQAQPAKAAATPDLGEAIATVNGKPISKAELASLTDEIAARGLAGRVTQQQLLDELIKREVLRQAAEAQQLDKTPETATRLANIQRSILAHAAGEAYIKANPISDEAVKQEYERQVAANKSTEYKARHILVKTEQEAKDIIKKLQAHGKFEELAKKSSDPGSAGKGGDLGWFSPQQMVGPFAEAVVKLENGKFTTEPVKTDFGWHVILREDSRDKTPPPFEAVKDQLRDSLQSTAMQKYLADLQAKAQVVRHDAPPPAPPAEAAPAAAPNGEAAKPAPAATPAPAGEAAKPAAPVPAAPAAEAAKPAAAVEAAPAAAPTHEHGAGEEPHEHSH
jgi:peptidyl-prolyl cis-trans isomerase C